jgi:RNA polymerase sigma factor (sigma-70 family)
VLINANIDSWRRRRREQLVEQPPEPSDAVADVAEAVDQRTTVIRAMRALAPRERAVVVLRYYLDLSEADTAAELGVTVGTVKSTASRALAKLRVTNAASTPGPSEAEGDNVRVPSGPRRDLS